MQAAILLSLKSPLVRKVRSSAPVALARSYDDHQVYQVYRRTMAQVSQVFKRLVQWRLGERPVARQPSALLRHDLGSFLDP